MVKKQTFCLGNLIAHIGVVQLGYEGRLILNFSLSFTSLGEEGGYYRIQMYPSFISHTSLPLILPRFNIYIYI